MCAAGLTSAATRRVPAQGFEEALQEIMATARPGDSLILPEGDFRLERSLTLAVSDVSIRGAGRDRTRLSFDGQSEGAQSWLVVANDVEISDLALIDPLTDGLVARGSTGFTVRRVAVEWTRPRSNRNGGYGIYPVNSAEIRIEDCVARGAREAGIYVGQSSDGIVAGNLVEGNVVGIDIENSTRVRVEDNRARANSIGILVAARPKLLQPRSSEIVVRGNEVVENDSATFAEPGSYLAGFGEGKGIVVVASKDVRIEENRLRGNDRAQVLFLNFQSLGQPDLFDAFFSADLDDVRLGNNVFERDSNRKPEPVERWQDARGFDVVWDGLVSAKPYRPETKPNPLCREMSVDLTYLNTSRENDGMEFLKDLDECH